MLTDEQITTLTNGFVKMGRRFGFKGTEGGTVGLFGHDDGWSLELVQPKSVETKSAKTLIKLPDDLPEGNLDAAIALAGHISWKLHDWNQTTAAANGSRKYQASLTPEQRSERARKAVEARIKKYGQKTKTDSQS